MEEYKIHPTALFDDIVMPKYFRETIMECIYLPMYFPEFFRNARRFNRGFLVFGPPGVGKTYMTQSVGNSACLRLPSERNAPKLSCYRLYTSDLMSKYSPDAEIVLRNVFSAAQANQPSIIIIEDMAALDYREGDSEFPRRVKCELILRIDDVLNSSDFVWVIGVTQLPFAEPSFRRRFTRRIYMTLPDDTIRRAVIKENMNYLGHSLMERDMERLVILTQGLTCSDISMCLRDASFKPLSPLAKATHFKKIQVVEQDTKSHRESEATDSYKYTVCDKDDPEGIAMSVTEIDPDKLYVRDVTMADCLESLKKTRPCMTREEIRKYDQYAMDYSLWEPPEQRQKKKRLQSLQRWCCEVISQTVCLHGNAMTADLWSLIDMELPLPEALRLRVLGQCAERLDLWINEHWDRKEEGDTVQGSDPV